MAPTRCDANRSQVVSNSQSEDATLDPAPRSAARKPTILIVEDVDLLRSLLQEFLHEEGFQTRIAGTCASAQRIIAHANIDAVVSDIRLPDGSGVAFCEVLRVAYPRLGIVMMTGFPNEQIPAWIDGDRVPLLHKPVNLLTLSEAVRTVLGQSPEL